MPLRWHLPTLTDSPHASVQHKRVVTYLTTMHTIVNKLCEPEECENETANLAALTSQFNDFHPYMLAHLLNEENDVPEFRSVAMCHYCCVLIAYAVDISPAKKSPL